MALLASLEAADARAVSLVAAGTWVVAHSLNDTGGGGQASIRFMRYMNVTDVTEGTFDTMNEIGAWDITNQDNVT